eukprot:1632077-Karenia_brevis.AAC.1
MDEAKKSRDMRIAGKALRMAKVSNINRWTHVSIDEVFTSRAKCEKFGAVFGEWIADMVYMEKDTSAILSAMAPFFSSC